MKTKQILRKIRRHFVKHRQKSKDFKIGALGVIGALSYMTDFHYNLIAPTVAVLIFIEVMRRR